MIKENEDITSWERNLFNAINDVSDLGMQKKAWLGKSPNLISSFSEVISILYDDFDFERYMKYYESVYGENEFLDQMKDLDKKISEFLAPISDELILSDPIWVEITEKARIISGLRKQYLPNDK